MEALFGPVAVACLLLLVAGGAKVGRPAPTAGALRALGLPGSPMLVRLLGAGEVVLGIATLMTGSRALVGLVAVTYLGFAAFVVAALRAGTDIQSCGCFGVTDTPPSPAHVALNLVLALTAAVAAVTTGVRSLTDELARQPAAGVPLILLVAVTCYLAHQILAVLPLTMQAMGPSGTRRR